MLLLNIQSSPRGARSASIAVTNAFLDAYQALHSDAMIDTLNVWEENLPDFDSEAIGAKYKGISHKPMDAAEAEIWERIQTLAKRLASHISLTTIYDTGLPLRRFPKTSTYQLLLNGSATRMAARC